MTRMIVRRPSQGGGEIMDFHKIYEMIGIVRGLIKIDTLPVHDTWKILLTLIEVDE